MSRPTLTRRILRGGLAATCSLGLLLAATAASAGHGDRGDRNQRRYRVYDHGDHCNSRYERRQHRGHGHHRDRYEARRDSYTCGPCNHRFDSRRKFHRHLTSHHHVPLFALPFVIVKSTLGWIFHG